MYCQSVFEVTNKNILCIYVYTSARAKSAMVVIAWYSDVILYNVTLLRDTKLFTILIKATSKYSNNAMLNV